MKNKKGFTLAELAITLAILAIVVASIISLTAITINKTYERRISYMYRNECQNIMNCFSSSVFTVVSENLSVTGFEEKLDYIYDLESETLDYKSHEFQTKETNKVIYEIYYNTTFNYVESDNPHAKFKIVCIIDYSENINKLSLKVYTLENSELLYQLPEILTKGMGV